MALFIGAGLAILVGIFATAVRLDRDRAFYPTVTIVVALLYVLFAVMASSRQAFLVECAVAAVFVIAAVLGFRYTLWIAAAALVAHGLFDFVHGAAISNPGVPDWWPGFCGAYDVVAGAYLAWLLKARRVAARPA